jgi:hypothetical protein
VGRGIIFSEIGFDFDDASSESSFSFAADQNFPEKIRSDEAGVAIVEFARDWAIKLFHGI